MREHMYYVLNMHTGFELFSCVLQLQFYIDIRDQTIFTGQLR